MATIILGFLGLTEFSEKDGKPVLTNDQRSKVLATFGEDFTSKFEKYLSKDENESEGESEAVVSLISAFTDAQAKSTASLEAKFQKQIDDLLGANKKLNDQIDTLALSAEDDVIPEMDKDIRRDASKPSIMKVDMRLPVYATVGHFLKTGAMRGVEAATIEVADLATEFGTYLSQGRNNLDEVQALFQGFTSADMFTSKMAITEWQATQALITSVSQQFSSKWTPSGKALFKPLKIRNRRHKINYPIIPADVLESYMMHMYDEGLAPDQMPITKYIWNNLIYPQLMQDVELRMIWKGKYVEKDQNTINNGDPGTPPEDSMTGIETFLVDNKVANAKKVGYHDVGAFNYLTATDQEVLDYVQDFMDWIAPIFRTKKMPIGCGDEFFKRYKRAYKNVWGPGSGKSDDANFGGNTIDFSKQYLRPIDGMFASPILFVTPKENLIKLRHKNDIPRVINDVQKHDYEVRTYGEYWLGAGFAYGEAVFASVPDGYDPKAEITKVYDAHDTYQQNKGIELAASAGGGL
ncbi:MAG: hypothetical protein RIC03_12495 [Cyclobacteriaceae bacterium]